MRQLRLTPALIVLVAVAIVAALAAVHFVRSSIGSSRLKIADVRLVSYFPARNGWELMWTKWDPAVIAGDFQRIADLHANTVRVIVPPGAFGYPEPRAAMLDRLEQAIRMADTAGLHVQLTLFDHWTSYGDERGSKLWAERVLTRYAGDRRIAFVEIRNEINPGDSHAMTWARSLLPYVQSLVSAPVTLSPAGRAGAETLQRLKTGLRGVDPDFWDIHLFARLNTAHATLAAIKDVAAPLPLLIGETGYATVAKNPRDPRVGDAPALQEAWQAHYLRTIAQAAHSLDLPPPAPWTLHDFAPGAIPADMRISQQPEQYHYGLLRSDGSAKPAFAAVRAAFDGRPVDQSVNSGFELGANDAGRSLPLQWLLGSPDAADYFRSTTIAHSGRASACIRDSGEGRVAPSYFTTPIDTGVQAGLVYRAGVWAKGIDASGVTSLSIAWYDADLRFLTQYQSPPLPAGTTPWLRLIVESIAPRSAAGYRVYLKSAGNRGTACFDDVGFG